MIAELSLELFFFESTDDNQWTQSLGRNVLELNVMIQSTFPLINGFMDDGDLFRREVIFDEDVGDLAWLPGLAPIDDSESQTQTNQVTFFTSHLVDLNCILQKAPMALDFRSFNADEPIGVLGPVLLLRLLLRLIVIARFDESDLGPVGVNDKVLHFSVAPVVTLISF
jgi:hypothetical protein